jgi:hypothetical protein
MRAFKDTKGRTWSVEITVASVKRVKSLVGVDLYALADDGLKPLGVLLADVLKLMDVLFVLARDEKGAPPESDESFAEALAGDVLGDAADAFVDALIDFFPRARARKALAAVRNKSKAVAEKVFEQAMKDLDRIDPAAVARTIRAGNPSSGKSPAGSE